MMKCVGGWRWGRICLPIAPLTNRRRLEDGRLRDARQRDGPLGPAQRVLRHARVVAKVRGVDLP